MEVYLSREIDLRREMVVISLAVVRCGGVRREGCATVVGACVSPLGRCPLWPAAVSASSSEQAPQSAAPPGSRGWITALPGGSQLIGAALAGAGQP